METKYFFLFCFFEREINLKVLRFFLKKILEIFQRKSSILIPGLYLTV